MARRRGDVGRLVHLRGILLGSNSSLEVTQSFFGELHRFPDVRRLAHVANFRVQAIAVPACGKKAAELHCLNHNHTAVNTATCTNFLAMYVPRLTASHWVEGACFPQSGERDENTAHN